MRRRPRSLSVTPLCDALERKLEAITKSDKTWEVHYTKVDWCQYAPENHTPNADTVESMLWRKSYGQGHALLNRGP